MKLITEKVEDLQILSEDTEDGKGKKLFIQGIFAQANVINRNKRYYPLDILEGEINRFVKEDIKNSSAVGELGHPEGPSINLDRGCILIKELKRTGNDFIGKASVLTTPMGKIVESLINDGVKLGVSTRALGTLKPMKEDANEVQNDLKLLTVDVVSNPSAPSAYVNGILESKEWIFDHGMLVEQTVDRHQKEILKGTVKHITENQTIWFNEFINSLTRINP